ncbi:MAG: thioesterase family protein [Deferrisomatales bacterium]|nr:thioesterase family protein [Deferrisomatales bacterium]
MIPARCRVIYGDTDNMGVVYYANYLRFFELGRNEYMRARGLTYREVEARGFQLPVTEARCRYRKPARYDDLLTVETRVTRARGARVVFSYEIRGEGGDVLAEGETEHAAVGPGGRPQRLPPDVLEILAPEER